jgi:hypothetical protein
VIKGYNNKNRIQKFARNIELFSQKVALAIIPKSYHQPEIVTIFKYFRSNYLRQTTVIEVKLLFNM